MNDVKLSHWKVDLETILGAPAERDTLDLITEICDFAADIGYENGDAVLDAFPELFETRPSLASDFRNLIVSREMAEAKRLLAAEIVAPTSFRAVAGPISAGMYDRLGDIFANVDFSSCQRVVMVGCGWRPITIFRLHDQTSVPEIIGLDVVPGAVETATALAAKLGYDRMRAELCDGSAYDYSGVRRVYVASMVSPKAAVISRILETAPEDVQIVLWEPHSLGRLWVDSAERHLDPQLEVIGRGSVTWLTRDVFVRRRNGSASAQSSGS